MSNLADVLANRTWLRRAWPFPHVVAQNVFTLDFYYALAGQLHEILGRGLSEKPAPEQFSRNIAGYDAYGFGFNQSLPDPLAIFLSPAWRDMMCGLFGIDATAYVFAGSHHHTIGSESGFIHNDFNPVWFPRSAGKDIQIPNNTLCSYKTGVGVLQESDKVEVVRGAVVLFFLLNDGWQSGYGGETGLYTSSQSRFSEPAMHCTPVNNSLLAFECTPHSFHAYLTNRQLPRTSIIMWVHRTMEETVEKFGEEKLERWRT